MGRRPIESEMNSIGMTCSPGTKKGKVSPLARKAALHSKRPGAQRGLWAPGQQSLFLSLNTGVRFLRELNIARIQRLECLLSRAEGVKGSAESRDPPDHIDRKDCLCTDTVDTLGHRSNIETA